MPPSKNYYYYYYDSPSHEDEVGDGDSDEVLHEEPRRLAKRRGICLDHWQYLTHGILLVLCALFMLLWLHATTLHPQHSLSLTPRSPYSPANEAVEYYEEYQRFRGTLNYTSIYRGPPSPEVDAAWIRVSTGVPPLRISREELIKSGVEDAPSKVRYSEEDGGGYMAALEVTHQLHCLDILRKSVYLEYYSQIDALLKARPETYRFHLDHCIDILRQVLMCSADVGMITFEWVRDFNIPYPNFNTEHQCRNFQRVISWGVANAAKVPNHRITRLEGQVDLEQVP